MVIKAVGITSEEVRLRGIFKLAGCLALVAAMAGVAEAQITSVTMEPLSTFGSNGWLAPGSSEYLTSSGNTQRGMSWNPVTNNVLVAFRQNVSGIASSIVRFDGTTGETLGVMNNTGVTGGAFAINMVDTAIDGAIYAGNLSTSATSNFKVYRWADETSVPSVVFDAATTLARTGDSFSVYSSSVPGSSVRFAAAGTNNTSASNFFVGSADGTNTGTAFTSVPSTSTTSNDYRLSLSYVEEDLLIGNQGGLARITSITGSTATVDASVSLGGASLRALDFLEVDGLQMLAVIDSNNSLVRIFDITDPSNPTVLAGPLTTTVGTLGTNGDGTGSVSWGNVEPISGGYVATLYAMNTNQGVQAFTVTMVPEPSTWSMLFAGAALGIFTLRRKGSVGRREMTA